jgi:hypothetical protein
MVMGQIWDDFLIIVTRVGSERECAHTIDEEETVIALGLGTLSHDIAVVLFVVV